MKALLLLALLAPTAGFAQSVHYKCYADLRTMDTYEAIPNSGVDFTLDPEIPASDTDPVKPAVVNLLFAGQYPVQVSLSYAIIKGVKDPFFSLEMKTVGYSAQSESSVNEVVAYLQIDRNLRFELNCNEVNAATFSQ